MYRARAAWSRLILPGAGTDPIWSDPDSAPGPQNSGAATFLGGYATMVVSISVVYVHSHLCTPSYQLAGDFEGFILFRSARYTKSSPPSFLPQSHSSSPPAYHNLMISNPLVYQNLKRSLPPFYHNLLSSPTPFYHNIMRSPTPFTTIS